MRRFLWGSWSVGLVASGLVLMLLMSCRPKPATGLEKVFDLGAELATAEVETEVRSIDFGDSSHRRHLVAGWSRGELDQGRNRSFAWGIGDVSVVELHLLTPRTLELTLEGRPFDYPGAQPQAVTVAVNDQRLGDLEFGPGLSTHRMKISREYLAAGANRLDLIYRWSRSPRELSQGGDRRSLAVAWYMVRVGAEGAAVPSPSPDLENPTRFFLPFGSEVAYHVAPSSGSELRIERWSTRGAVRGTLELTLQAEAQPAQRLGVLARSGRGATLPLPAGNLFRLALRAIPEPQAKTGLEQTDEDAPEISVSGVMLDGAAIWAPAEELDAETATSISPETAPPGPQRPNVVLYVIDTLRADHLGCYGYDRPLSPRLDAFAEQAVLFERAVAQSSWTRSSMASIFTGLWPYTHATNRRSERLSEAAQTLPERLQAVGYQTVAFITNPNLTAGFGFDQGFDHFDYLGEEATSADVHQRVVDWLAARDDEDPFLLYVHTLDPHAPYIPPTDVRERWAPQVSAATAAHSMQLVDDLQAGRIEVSDALLADLEALYDAEIAANDTSFGALIDELTAHELYDEALVIVVSDHGEEFHEHGNWQHGRALHNESINVPLILKLPGMQSGQRIVQRVQHIDLLPTLLATLGLEIEPTLEGRSLLPLLRGGSTVPPSTIVPASDPTARVFSYLHLDGAARVSVQEGNWKLIQQIEHGQLVWPRLYDLATDPTELENLADRYPVRTGYLAAVIRRKLAAPDVRLEAADGVIDEGVKKSLQALGYLD